MTTSSRERVSIILFSIGRSHYYPLKASLHCPVRSRKPTKRRIQSSLSIPCSHLATSNSAPRASELRTHPQHPPPIRTPPLPHRFGLRHCHQTAPWSCRKTLPHW